MHRRLMITATIALTLISVSSSARGDWTRFRGPNGSDISSSHEVTPTTWSESENLRWKVPLPGPGSSSPILHKNLLIVTVTAESEALVALDKRSGKEVWRQEAAGFNSVWGTPVLAEAGDGRIDLVSAVPNEIWGLNPDTGKLRW